MSSKFLDEFMAEMVNANCEDKRPDGNGIISTASLGLLLLIFGSSYYYDNQKASIARIYHT